MGVKTGIQYSDSTINPVMGCVGCELYDQDVAKSHCYAHKMTHHYAGGRGWPKRFEEPTYFPKRLRTAVSWSDLTEIERPGKPWLNGLPRVIFVNDMSDGFCPGGISPKEWWLPEYDAMGQSPHIWLILTKWPKRMARFIAEQERTYPNIWLGTSVTGPGTLWRLDALLRIEKHHPSERRWTSLEPLLAPVDVTPFLLAEWGSGAPAERKPGWLYPEGWVAPKALRIARSALDWIVWGGESGTNARMPPINRFDDLRVMCDDHGVPGFFKQYGGPHHQGWVQDGKLYCDEHITPAERNMPLWRRSP